MKGVSNSFQRKIVLSRKIAGGITAKKNHSLAPNSAILRETTCYLYISKPPNVSVWYNSIFSPRHHHVFFPVTKLQDLTFIPCRMPKILEDLPRCSGSAKGAVNSTSVLTVWALGQKQLPGNVCLSPVPDLRGHMPENGPTVENYPSQA